LQVAAELAQLHGECARLRRPVVAQRDGGGGQAVRREKLAPQRHPRRVRRVGGRQGNVREHYIIRIKRDIQRVERFVKERFEMLLPEGGVVQQKTRNQHMLALVGDGFGGTRRQQAQRVQHGHRAQQQRAVNQRHQRPCSRRASSNGRYDAHAAPFAVWQPPPVPWRGRGAKKFSMVWKHSAGGFMARMVAKRGARGKRQ